MVGRAVVVSLVQRRKKLQAARPDMGLEIRRFIRIQEWIWQQELGMVVWLFLCQLIRIQWIWQRELGMVVWLFLCPINMVGDNCLPGGILSHSPFST
jgi:hypothetical protein